MNHRPIGIEHLTEDQFDRMILECGGSRFVEDSSIQEGANADYLLFDNLIELKLIEEEGLNKDLRQQKIAELFAEAFPDDPVIVLDPSLLNEDQKRRYLRMLEVPIKTQVKKASKQLQSSEKKLGTKIKSRVLVIINVGYMALRQDLFKELVTKCVFRDSSGIDHVLVGGIYYDSDNFDSYVIASLEDVPINLARPFESELLTSGWGSIVRSCMKTMFDPSKQAGSRLPTEDIHFKVEDRIFVRPRPQIGKPSAFWINGRPRKNSSGIESCPPTASVLPKISMSEWQLFKDSLSDPSPLRESYAEWLGFCKDTQDSENGLRPTVCYPVSFSDWENYLKNQEIKHPLLEDISRLAADLFEPCVRDLIDGVRELPASLSVPGKYVYFETREIGIDKDWDVSAIYLVSAIVGFERIEVLLPKQRLFFEYALAVACSYAVKHEVESVFYQKDLTYAWV